MSEWFQGLRHNFGTLRKLYPVCKVPFNIYYVLIIESTFDLLVFGQKYFMCI